MFATGYKDYFKTSKFSHQNNKNLNGMKVLTSRIKSDDNRLNEIFNHIGLNEQKIYEKPFAGKTKTNYKKPYRIKPVEKSVKHDYQKKFFNKNIHGKKLKNNDKKNVNDHDKVDNFHNDNNKNEFQVLKMYDKNDLNEEKPFDLIISQPNYTEKTTNEKIEKSEKYTNTLPVIILDDNGKKYLNNSTPINTNTNTTSTNFNNNFMSLRKKKQLEWEKEKADAERYYSPWGKSGGGTHNAPLKPSTFQNSVTMKEGSPHNISQKPFVANNPTTLTTSYSVEANNPTTPTTPTKTPGFTKLGHQYMDVDEEKEKIKKMQYISYQKELGEQIKDRQERRRLELEKIRKLEEEEEKNFNNKNNGKTSKLNGSAEINTNGNSHYERYNNRVIGVNKNLNMDYYSNFEPHPLSSSPAMSKLMPTSKERITNKNTVLYSTEKEREENKKRSYALHQSMLLEQIEAKKLEKELQRQNRLREEKDSASYNLMA